MLQSGIRPGNDWNALFETYFARKKATQRNFPRTIISVTSRCSVVTESNSWSDPPMGTGTSSRTRFMSIWKMFKIRLNYLRNSFKYSENGNNWRWTVFTKTRSFPKNVTIYFDRLEGNEARSMENLPRANKPFHIISRLTEYLSVWRQDTVRSWTAEFTV